MSISPVTPTTNDILLGRGASIRDHPGNVAFRALVIGRKADFNRARKLKKRAIAMEIIQHVKDNNRRFLIEHVVSGKRNERDRIWVVAEEAKALQKTMHRLREKEWVSKSEHLVEEKVHVGSSCVELGKDEPECPNIEPRAIQGQLSPGFQISAPPGDELAHDTMIGSGDDKCLDECDEKQDLGSDLDELGSVQDSQLVQDLQDKHPGKGNSLIDSIQDNDLWDLENEETVTSEKDDDSESFGTWDLENERTPGRARSGVCATPGYLHQDLYGGNTHQSLCFQQEVSNNEVGSLKIDGGQVELVDRSADNANVMDVGAMLLLQPAVLLPDQLSEVQHQVAEKQSTEPPETEMNLGEWIDSNIPRGLCFHGELSGYIRTAIPIAINLTELLVAEDQTNPEIELRSCRELSVLLCAGRITRVVVRTSATSRSKFERLVSLGAIFYELFSGQILPSWDAESDVGGGLDQLDLNASVGGIVNMLQHDDDQNPKKRFANVPSSGSQKIDPYHNRIISSLVNARFPASICGMIMNLLECKQSEFRLDESYSSFGDVLVDLKLVRDNPCCYLESVGNSPTLSIPNKLYGRQDDVDKITGLFKGGACKGLIVNGRAGVGKSSLLSQVFSDISEQNDSYFVQTKFEQSGINPLAIVASVFNSLCRAFTRVASSRTKEVVARELESALGVAGINALSLIIPRLSKILKSPDLDSTDHYMNQAASVSYSFRKLLEIISSHSAPITLLFDDLQFADMNSRSIIYSLLSDTAQAAFFICCYRDDDVKPGNEFSKWLESLESCGIEKVEVENLTTEGVNEMVSESLRAFPRITLPLSTQLHAKTRGNPLFLRQFMDSLYHQGLIYLSLYPPRWSWDLDKISNVEMPVSVVSLLIAEMQTLPTDLKQGLRVASCLGSTVEKGAIDVIASRMGLNFAEALEKLVKKGFLISNNGFSEVRFSHDKVQQSAYETMTVSEQKLLHLQLGLLLCEEEPDDGYLLFTAVTQANMGGVNTSLDPRKRVTIATLNLRAGIQTKKLSAFDIALGFSQNGILWMPIEDRWSTNYATTLGLHVCAIETACLVNNIGIVTKYTDQVVANARSYEEHLTLLKGLFCLMKCLMACGRLFDSRNIGFSILTSLGEQIPRELGDPGLTIDLNAMTSMLHGTADEAILTMRTSHQARQDVLLLDVFSTLTFIFLEYNPQCNLDVSRRMLEITLTNGLAKQLVARPMSHRFASIVSLMTGVCVDWMVEPLQSVVESLSKGHKSGLQVGDLTNARGKDFKDSFLSWDELRTHTAKQQNRDSPMAFQAHSYMRSFLFQSFDDDVMEGEGLLSKLLAKRSPVRPLLIIGVFYEGLLAFHLGRIQQQQHLITRGNQVLEFIKRYSDANPFAFENKVLLLEASRMELSDSKETDLFYQKAIKSARDHKFVHVSVSDLLCLFGAEPTQCAIQVRGVGK
ncbi:hypothetical protein THAOC_16117 [Thalassiosira oceanica]|uniref:Uncharacterized protein n=1 Tax=Thalassiosira oceanica TaxID=159749 RepID=K0SE64_THAOC|nr:hypothetical protein THAOC_16117 [Thalassiosira oceanica]|eukprot:EJK63239.1 hypothetical protein THAOC_16117 [Thalassiosira oceanica]